LEPSEALSTAAQIAVALAGFAGVVVVFRRQSVHEWSPIDKFRLRLLLTNSVLPLILCIIGLLLLGVRPVPSGIWRWCSGVAFCFISPWVITAIAVFYRSGLYRLQGAGANFVTYLFRTLGVGITLLQLYNAALLGAFWPFFAGIAFHLISAVLQFARMIVLPPETRQ
jgi:hypothetical protein